MIKGKDSNEWWSDDEWYESLCQKYKIFPLLDAAATVENAKCKAFLTNALPVDWICQYPKGLYDVVDVWCNPPLNKGLCRKFILKAEEQWRQWNMNIMMPVPAGVISRQYFRHLWDEFMKSHGKTVFIDPIPRPKFLLNGEKKAFARNDYIMLIFYKQ